MSTNEQKFREEFNKWCHDNAYAHGCSTETGYVGMDDFYSGAKSTYPIIKKMYEALNSARTYLGVNESFARSKKDEIKKVIDSALSPF